MAKVLRKRLKKLHERREAFEKIKKVSRSKNGNPSYKEPGSMNKHK